VNVHEIVTELLRAARAEIAGNLKVGNTLETAGLWVRGATVMDGALYMQPRQQPSFASGWLWYSSPWDGGYWKDAQGIVHLDGLVTNNSASPSSTIYTLPEGYRPSRQQMYAQSAYATTGTMFQRLDIGTNGLVAVVMGQGWGITSATTYTASATPNATWISLHGITFRTD
jgi:hypothetical protein